MKALNFLSVFMLLLSVSSCLQKDDYAINNEFSQLEQLQLFAQENGYTDFVLNTSKTLTPSELQLCKSLIKKRVKTRAGNIESHMYITKINEGFLQFDYSRDRDTKEVIEAYGGVYGSNDRIHSYPDRYPGKYVELHTLYSRLEFKSNTRFDLIIKAYRTISTDEGRYSSSMTYDKKYRLVIAAGLNVDTLIHNITIHEQGEGEWPLEL